LPDVTARQLALGKSPRELSQPSRLSNRSRMGLV